MGFIKDAIKGFDGAAAAKQEMEAQLDNMSALAKAKADYFELILKDSLTNSGTGTDKNIPVKFILDFTRQTHAYGSSSAESIGTTVTDAINGFISGGQENVMAGVSSLLTKSIQVLFASKDGSEQESKFTSVFAEGRALVRLDVFAWKRFTNVASLSKSAEQISAFVMCKSTIDATVLDYNTFIQLYQKALYEKSTGFTADEISEQLDKIHSIYEQFLSHQKEKPALQASNKFLAPSKSEIHEALKAIKEAEAKLEN